MRVPASDLVRRSSTWATVAMRRSARHSRTLGAVVEEAVAEVLAQDFEVSFLEPLLGVDVGGVPVVSAHPENASTHPKAD